MKGGPYVITKTKTKVTEPKAEEEDKRTKDLPWPITLPSNDRARGRRRGQKDLPSLRPVTEPKAEEEDNRTKDLPCLKPMTQPKAEEEDKRTKDLPFLGPVIEPDAKEED